MLVVVLEEVVWEPPELALVPDQGAVEEFVAAEFAVDSAIAPGRVVGVAAEHESADVARVGSRPVRGCGGCVQWRATRRLCQRITVASLTVNITRSSLRRSKALDNKARIVRSAGMNSGRSICRWRTRI